MENIYEILKEYGLEVPADKKVAFDKAWKENYRTKSEYDNPVQEKIAKVTDDELLGSDAQVTVVMVDLFETKADDANTCTARKRDWSVIPDTEGDGTDALIYKGSLKAAGEIIKGTATTTDGWRTCTFATE